MSSILRLLQKIYFVLMEHVKRFSIYIEPCAQARKEEVEK